MRCFLIFFSFFVLRAAAQDNREIVYSGHSYSVFDSICIPYSHDYVIVAFDAADEGESVLIYCHSGLKQFYPNVLTCLKCGGRGDKNNTFMGFRQAGRCIVFAEQYFNGVDSVFIDFGAIASYKKIVRRSYTNEPQKSIDDIGNYLIKPKDKFQIPVSDFSAPIDIADKNVRKKFTITKIQWQPIVN